MNDQLKQFIKLLTAQDYQRLAARTLLDEPGFELTGQDLMTLWCAIGLAGEVGEVNELIKKGLLHQHGLDVEKLKKEIGDVSWYLAGLCTTLHLDWSEILQQNIDKLLERYPKGFTSQDSIRRKDVK